MPVQNLPAGIPAPLMTPHSRSDESAFGMMPVALGHSRKRRLLIRAPETATLQWRLPVALSAAWDEWYWTTLRGGAYEARLRVRAYGTAPEQTVIARMVEPPRFSRQFGFCDVSVSVVINPDTNEEWPFGGGGGGSFVPDAGVTGDEWRVYNSVGDAPSGDAPNVWTAQSSGTLTPTATPAFVWLQRRTVTRANPPPGTTTIVTDAVNTSTTPPTTAWVPVTTDPAPILEVVNAANGLWRLTTSNPLQGIAFGPMGTFTIGNASGALRTAISRTSGFYPPIAWEYAWAA